MMKRVFCRIGVVMRVRLSRRSRKVAGRGRGRRCGGRLKTESKVERKEWDGGQGLISMAFGHEGYIF
jgi:hypothetical protein